MGTSNIPLHPVQKALIALKRSPAWLASAAWPENPAYMRTRLSDVFSGRRANFSARDGLAIYRVLRDRVPRRVLDIDDVLDARPRTQRRRPRSS